MNCEKKSSSVSIEVIHSNVDRGAGYGILYSTPWEGYGMVKEAVKNSGMEGIIRIIKCCIWLSIQEQILPLMHVGYLMILKFH